MGNFVSRAGLSRELFRAAYAFIGHWRGGLAMSTIVACAGFGSICGSSRRHGGDDGAGRLSAMMRSTAIAIRSPPARSPPGGTLGILIPPSVIMVIYSIMTETNIGELFAAGVVPGLIATVL